MSECVFPLGSNRNPKDEPQQVDVYETSKDVDAQTRGSSNVDNVGYESLCMGPLGREIIQTI